MMLDKLLMVRSDGTKYFILSRMGKCFSVFNLSTITYTEKRTAVYTPSNETIPTVVTTRLL